MSVNFTVTLYKPIEVELEGQKFTLRKLNRALFRRLAEFEKMERAAKDQFETIEVVYEEMKAFVDAPAEVIDDLDDRQLMELKDVIDQVVFKKKKVEDKAEDAEKNGPKPGEETAAS